MFGIVDTASSNCLSTDSIDGHSVVIRSISSGRLTPRSRLLMAMLAEAKVQVSIVDLTINPGRAAELMRRSGCGYVPQLFYKGEFIGGASIASEFLRSGEHHRIDGNFNVSRDHSLPHAEKTLSKAIWRLIPSGPLEALACSATGAVYVLTAPNFAKSEHRVCDGWVNAAVRNPDTMEVCLGTSDAKLLAFDRLGAPSRAEVRHERWVNDLSPLDNTGGLLVADGAGVLSEYCKGSLKLRRSRKLSDSPLWVVTVDDDENTICAGDGAGCLHFLDARSWSTLFMVKVDAHCVTSVAYSSSLDEFVAVGFEGKIVGVRQGLMTFAIQAHRRRSWCVALVNAGHFIVSTSADDTVRIHRRSDLEQIAVLQMKRPISLAIVGAYLLVGDEEGKTHSLELSTLVYNAEANAFV